MKNWITSVTSVLTLILTFSFGLQAQKSDQQITFHEIPQKTYGDPTFQLSGTATSGLSVNFVSSNLDVATVNGTTVTIIGAGETIITARQVGDANFNPAPPVTQSFW